jgi:hypothetical protein
MRIIFEVPGRRKRGGLLLSEGRRAQAGKESYKAGFTSIFKL